MESYVDLLGVLYKHKNNYQEHLEAPSTTNSQVSIDFLDLFDVLIWKLCLESNSFNLISSDFGYHQVPTCNFKGFLQSIKPCFQDYFIEFFKKYYQLIIKNKLQLSDYRLKCTLPIRLEKDHYQLCSICIVSILKNYKTEGFYFTVMPLKEYRNDFPSISIHKNRKEDPIISYQLKNLVSIKLNLTKKQLEVFHLILKGYSSLEIAKQLKKNKETILDYNSRIKVRLSEFFEIKFDNVIEGVNYYKNCFYNKF